MVIQDVGLEPLDALESPLAQGTDFGVVTEVAVVCVFRIYSSSSYCSIFLLVREFSRYSRDTECIGHD